MSTPSANITTAAVEIVAEAEVNLLVRWAVQQTVFGRGPAQAPDAVCWWCLDTAQCRKCRGCRVTVYCCKRCQAKGWRYGGHRIECTDLQSEKRAVKDAVTNLTGSAARPGHVAGLGLGLGGGGAADVADDADGAAACDVGIRRPKMLALNFYTDPEDENSAHPAFCGVFKWTPAVQHFKNMWQKMDDENLWLRCTETGKWLLSTTAMKDEPDESKGLAVQIKHGLLDATIPDAG
eukprot:gene9397-4926_t